MLSVALVGAGRVGRIRAAVIQNSGDAAVKVVADVNLPRAQELAQQTRAKATSEWRAAVARRDVDAVVVATPTKFHAEIALAGLEAGKHVLCEKPLARTVDEAHRIVGLAESARRVLKTGFNYRHMAHVRKAKALIEDGALGPLYFLRCRYGHGGRPGYEKAWYTDAELSGGGVLLEQGIHIFDLVRYLLGEPSEILVHIQRFFWDFPSVEDNGFCLLQTEAGQLAQIHVSWTQWVNLFDLEIFGQHGYLELQGRDGHYGPQRLTEGRRKPDHSRPAEQSFEFAPPDDSWEVEWREFLNAIQTGQEPLGSGWDGLRAQQIVEAAYQSARRQGWVEIPSLEGQPATDR